MEVRKERKRWGRRDERGREEEDSIEMQTDDWERVLEIQVFWTELRSSSCLILIIYNMCMNKKIDMNRLECMNPS